MNIKIHEFERAGLGTAPFALQEYFFSEQFDMCAFCGQGIKNVFAIRSADGKLFNVGSVCVKKTGDAGLIKRAKAEMNRVAKESDEAHWVEVRAKNEEMNRKIWAQEAEERKVRGVKAWAEFKRVQPIMATMAHPNAYFAKQGKTLLDYVNYFKPEVDGLYQDKVLGAIKQAGGDIR